MCIYIYIRVYNCVYMCVYVYINAFNLHVLWWCVRIDVYRRITRKLEYTYTYIYLYTHIYICTEHIYIYIYTHIYICIYMYIHIIYVSISEYISKYVHTTTARANWRHPRRVGCRSGQYRTWSAKKIAPRGCQPPIPMEMGSWDSTNSSLCLHPVCVVDVPMRCGVLRCVAVYCRQLKFHKFISDLTLQEAAASRHDSYESHMRHDSYETCFA